MHKASVWNKPPLPPVPAVPVDRESQQQREDREKEEGMILTLVCILHSLKTIIYLTDILVQFPLR